MPNIKKIVGPLGDLLRKIPTGSRAAEEAFAAEMAARKAAQEAAYAPHTLPTEKGKKTIAKAKKTLGKEDEAVQAPSVVIPSKVSNVEQAIRQSKGEYGAKRVQRAADNIPNLGNLYTEKALTQAFGGDNAKALMAMNPADFEEFAHPILELETRRRGIEPNKANYPTEEYIKYLSELKGFDDVPFLQINKEEQGLPLIPYISGHEGRHRSRALANRGESAGLVQLLPRAELREPFPRRSQEEYLEALLKELEMTGNLVLPEKYFPADEYDFNKQIQRPAKKLPELFADGGSVEGGSVNMPSFFNTEVNFGGSQPNIPVPEINASMLGQVSKAKGGVIDLDEIVHSAMQRGVQKMGVGGAIKKAAKKASEVFGKHEGKTLMITEADRTKVGQGFLGGPGFSGLQHEYPAYKEAQAAWGVASPSKASTMVGANARVPQGQAIWAPMLGSPTQHKSNQMVFDQILNKFRRAAKAGELDPELHAKINDALASAIDKNTGNPIFPPDVDIMGKNFRSIASTFDRRAAAADIMGGIGVGGKKGMIIDYPEIIKSTTDPVVIDSPVGSIGNRAFTLTGEVGLHPELHPAFPYILRGEDLGEVYTPIPRELALRDYVEERAASGKKPSVWAFTRGHGPSQIISEDWLTNLQKNNYAKGGLAVGGVPEKRDVSQLFPLNPKLTGEVTEDGGAPSEVMFKPKPLQMPAMFTDAANALKSEFNKERRSMSKPGAVSDVLLRGPAAFAMGAPSDIVQMGGDALDWLQTKIPALRKPASVMDTGPEKTPPMGYAPKVQLGPEGQMPYGTEHAQELMKRAGMTTDEERPLFELGSALAAPFAPKAGKLAYKGAKKLAPTAAEMALDIASKYGVDPRMNIIKPKGGNWLSGSVDDATKRVKRYSSPPINREAELLAEVEEANKLNLPGYLNAATNDLQQLRIDMAADKWVEKKLNPYIKNEMGTETDPIRLGIERRAAEGEKLKQINQTRLAKMEADIAKAKAAGKDTTLSEGDLEKAREKFANEEYIATQGLFHKTIPEAGWTEPPPPQPYLTKRREREGMPIEDISTHPAAKRWERAVDMEMEPIKASRYQEDQNILDKNPYLSKLAPDSSVYSLDAMSDATFEFRHMMDEVKEAMNPQTVLPKSLRISPKDLEKMTVDDVSALSGKISAWRDTQKVKANLEADKNPAIHLFKEYTENNPKGVSWRQIKLPEDLPLDQAKALVREATEYEGEMMRHCVGGAGHCEPLLNGEVEIYSLRDAKGEPHVTIEVQPAKKYTEDDVYEKFPGGVRDAAKSKTLDQYIESKLAELNNQPSKILEIKGKNNRKPNPEYIPFVQDFVKSGNFSSVGDIHNTDLVHTKNAPWKKRFEDAGIDVPNYVSDKEYENLVKQYFEKTSTPVDPKFMQETYGIPMRAQGGAVRMAEGGVIDLDDLVAQALSKNVTVNLDDMVHQALTKRFAKGGATSNAI
jgi:hypothetical protein